MKNVYLLPFQKKMVNSCYNDNNEQYNTILLSSVTNSGKTLIAYDYTGILNNNIKSRIIYTSPIKALSLEKFNDLYNDNNFSNRVGIETGDIKYNIDSDILFCTQEVFNNKYTNIKDSYIIIDEIHYYISNWDRSRSCFESLSKIDPSNKLLMMSGTLSNIKNFADYIESITVNRKVHIIENEERLIPLKFNKKGIKIKNIINSNSIIFSFSQKHINNIINKLLIPNINIYEDYKISEIYDILGKYKCNMKEMYKYGIAEYHGKYLLPKEKLCVMELYNNELINILVSTPALSLGVNISAEKVIFSDLHEGINRELISSNDFNQMANRCGRYNKGYKNGIATYINDKNINISLKEDFKYLCDAKLEEPIINISPNINELINGKDINIELDEMLRLHYPNKNNNKNIKKRYRNDINYQLSIYNEYSYNIKSNEGNKIFSLWEDTIKKVYLPEFNIDKNCMLVSYYCNRIYREDILDVMDIVNYDIDNLIDDHSKGNILYEMLLMRKFCRKFIEIDNNRFVNYNKLDEIINDIDHTVLKI
jgi:superfamily II RNA helicase